MVELTHVISAHYFLTVSVSNNCYEYFPANFFVDIFLNLQMTRNEQQRLTHNAFFFSYWMRVFFYFLSGSIKISPTLQRWKWNFIFPFFRDLTNHTRNKTNRLKKVNEEILSNTLCFYQFDLCVCEINLHILPMLLCLAK